MISLVEQAKQIGVRDYCRETISKERIDLAIAWALDEVTITQASKALSAEKKVYASAIYNVLALGLREAVRNEILKKVK